MYKIQCCYQITIYVLHNNNIEYTEVLPNVIVVTKLRAHKHKTTRSTYGRALMELGKTLAKDSCKK